MHICVIGDASFAKSGTIETMTLTWIADRLDAGTPVALARVVAVSGFGGKRSGEVMGVSADELIGALAMGAANEATAAAARTLLEGNNPVSGVSLVVPVGDAEAVSAGLACGGSATVLVQRAQTLPASFWASVKEGLAVVLASDRSTGESMAVALDSVQGSVGQATDETASAARQMLAKGPIERNIEVCAQMIHLELIAPQPRLLVLGDAELSKALVRQGTLLGWNVEVRSDVGSSATDAEAFAASCGPLDGVVVLSHDVGVSCAVLAAALNGLCGYVGALGSRHTQGARRDHLVTLGLSPELIERVHGPVGLDLGSRTPEETALAIAAEMIAARSGRTARSLSAT
jgi:xanthine dehydrogenase accessory factor